MYWQSMRGGTTLLIPYCYCAAQLFFPTVAAYMLVSFFQGGAGTGSGGMLNNLRSYLWIPIAQDAYRYGSPCACAGCSPEPGDIQNVNFLGWQEVACGAG